MTGYKKRRVTLALGQAEELLCQCVRCLLVLPLEDIEFMEARQDPEELRGLLHLLAQLPRPGIGPTRFWGSSPPGDCQRSAECNLQDQPLLGLLHRVRQRLE